MIQPDEVLGIDIGGVIIARSTDGDDTSFFSDNWLQTPEVDGAFEAIRQLVADRFAGRVQIVSKAGPATEARSREWLRRRGFHELTGIAPEALHFCLARADKDAICRRLGVTCFIDDRLEVLACLTDVSTRILFQPDPAEVAGFERHRPEVIQVQSWNEVLATLL